MLFRDTRCHRRFRVCVRLRFGLCVFVSRLHSLTVIVRYSVRVSPQMANRIVGLRQERFEQIHSRHLHLHGPHEGSQRGQVRPVPRPFTANEPSSSPVDGDICRACHAWCHSGAWSTAMSTRPCAWVWVLVLGYESLCLGMSPCAWVWVLVLGYESLCLGMSPCAWVWVLVLGYESLCLGMSPCAWVWVLVLGYESLCLGMSPLCLGMSPCAWVWVLVLGYESLCLGMSPCAWVWVLVLVFTLLNARPRFPPRSPGFGLSLVAETTQGVFLGAELVSSPQGQGDPMLPEDLGRQCAKLLLEEVYRVSATAEPFVHFLSFTGSRAFLCCCCGPLAEMRYTSAL